MIFTKAIYYDSCKSMPLTAYIEYLETQELKHFSSLKKMNKECEQAYLSFFNDFLIVSENRDVIDKFVKLHKIEKLKGKYNICSLLIYHIRNFDIKLGKDKLDALVNELDKWDFKNRQKKELFIHINYVETRLNGIFTQIKLLESEVSKKDNKEAISIPKQLNIMENIQEKKYRLKAEDLTVLDYLEIKKDCDRIVESRNTKK